MEFKKAFKIYPKTGKGVGLDSKSICIQYVFPLAGLLALAGLFTCSGFFCKNTHAETPTKFTGISIPIDKPDMPGAVHGIECNDIFADPLSFIPATQMTQPVPGNTSPAMSAQLSKSRMKWAGVRSSSYGIKPFPDACGWANAMNTITGYFPDSTPTGVWLVGGIYFAGADSGQKLEFPNPGGTWDSRIRFAESDRHEQYLSWFDAHGIKVFLQFEPGFAPVDQLFEITYKRYGQHSCVIGFGVDVEWYHSQKDGGRNDPINDATAQAWESKVKSLNPKYRLFLKHFDTSSLPPAYRGDIIFVDDSQQHGSYKSFLDEMIGFADFFYPADVMYQVGYRSDKGWWGGLAKPIPKTIGNDLIRRIRQKNMGIIWVDFSLRDVLPTNCPQ